MFSTIAKSDVEVLILRQQANYWRSRHGKAKEREEYLKDKVRHLTKANRKQEAEIQQLRQQNEALKARLAWMQQQVFGRKSEAGDKQDKPAVEKEDASASDSPQPHDPSSCDTQRNRGQQPGTKGHGRKLSKNLPVEEKEWDLPQEEQKCPRCGKPRYRHGTKDSEEIDWEVRLVRKVHKRVRYRKSCDCPDTPEVVTAPIPAKLIPKGMFTIGFWVHLLLEKYLFQRPLHRVQQVLELEGFSVSQGTLTGGLQRLWELVHPLYARILERSRQANHWQMDETRWMVFVEVEGKAGYRWWLWVVVTKDTCSYLLEPTRSGEVPKNHLGEQAEGIINADRYSVYKSLGLKLLIAFCWSHIRRDFIRIRDGYKNLRAWAEGWVERINRLFHLNEERLKVAVNTEAFGERDQALRAAVHSMKETLERELEDETLHSAQRKALNSLQNHWAGATLFVDHPEIPMDNNESERRLRNPVVGRKNYYGSGSIWSGTLAAAMFTIFQTLLMNQNDPQKFLFTYFQACAEHGGRAPEGLDAFCPWNFSDERKDAFQYPRQAP